MAPPTRHWAEVRSIRAAAQETWWLELHAPEIAAADWSLLQRYAPLLVQESPHILRYAPDTNEITRGFIHLTGTVRFEDRGGALLLVQELDLIYLWTPPLPFSRSGRPATSGPSAAPSFTQLTLCPSASCVAAIPI